MKTRERQIQRENERALTATTVNCLLSWFRLRCVLCPWQGFVFSRLSFFFFFVFFFIVAVAFTFVLPRAWKRARNWATQSEASESEKWLGPFYARYSFSKRKSKSIFFCPGGNILRGRSLCMCAYVYMCKYVCVCICVCGFYSRANRAYISC